MRDIDELGMQLTGVADIIFQRGGKQRVKREMPQSLVDSLKSVIRQVLYFELLEGKTLINFADEFTNASKLHDWKFFLQDEKKLIEAWCENATKFAVWEVSANER
jgi:hypothetical protein